MHLPLFLESPAVIQEMKLNLISAVKNNDVEHVENILKRKKLDVNHPDPKFGASALYYACQWGRTKIVAELLKHPRIQVNQVTEGTPVVFTHDYSSPSSLYTTPLHIACARGFTSIVEMLLRHKKINPNLIINGMTPLHAAIRNGQAPVIEILLRHKAVDINACNDEGMTPLHFASEQGSKKAVELLLKRADLRIRERNRDGMNAMDLAVEAKEGEIAEMIKEEMKRRNVTL